MVEEIKDIRTELKTCPLGEFSVLYQREIKVLERRAYKGIAAQIAKVRGTRYAETCSRVPITGRSKCREIQDGVRSVGSAERIAHYIRPLEEFSGAVVALEGVQVI